MMNLTRTSALDKVRSKEIKRSSKTDSMDNYVSSIDRSNGAHIPIDGIGVKDLMKVLVEEQQFVLQKIYFEGFTHSELSKEFEIPLGTIKSLLWSALKHLRKTIRA